MNWKQLVAAFRTPQGAISVLTVLVTVGGEAGILSTPLSSALQALLTAVLGVLAAVVHQGASASLLRRVAAGKPPAQQVGQHAAE